MICFRYRRSGIATLLLQTFINHLQSSEQNSKIKAIYLHVLTTNQPAILFYERYKWVKRYSVVDMIKITNCFSSFKQLHSSLFSTLLLFHQRKIERRVLLRSFYQWWPSTLSLYRSSSRLLLQISQNKHLYLDCFTNSFAYKLVQLPCILENSLSAIATNQKPET